MITRLMGRAWDRSDYLDILWRLSAKAGAEIGVYNGEMSELFLRCLPGCKMYLIDPWRQLPIEEYKDTANSCDEVQEARYWLVQAIVGNNPNAVILRKRSREALEDVEDGSLDFVYIDANHKPQEVLFDIENWSKKVRKGGIVSGHDFDVPHLFLMETVINYCAGNQVRELLVCGGDHIWLFVKGDINGSKEGAG